MQYLKKVYIFINLKDDISLFLQELLSMQQRIIAILEQYLFEDSEKT
jgi:hypothetical protein